MTWLLVLGFAQNDSLATLLARLEGILGPVPRALMREGRYSQRYYTRSGALFDRNPRTVRLRLTSPRPCHSQVTARKDVPRSPALSGRSDCTSSMVSSLAPQILPPRMSRSVKGVG